MCAVCAVWKQNISALCKVMVGKGGKGGRVLVLCGHMIVVGTTAVFFLSVLP